MNKIALIVKHASARVFATAPLSPSTPRAERLATLYGSATAAKILELGAA